MLQRIPSVLLLTFLLASPAHAMQHEPTGLGKARFGMSPKEVEKIYKDKVRVLGQESLGATPVFSPFIVRQVLADQKVPGLPQPTNVELRYWKDKLWVIIVYYGHNGTEAANEALRKEYGKPDVSGQDSVWNGAKTLVNTSNREGWYAIADRAVSGEAQAAFMEEMRKMQEKMRASQGPPAPPPAPAEK